MTLIEIVIVVVIMALASAGMSMSLGAISRANLRSGAGKLGGAMRYAYNRAVSRASTVRLVFKLSGNTFSIEEAHGGVLLSTRKDKEDKRSLDARGKAVDAVDPWAAAEARIKTPDKPTVGASPFSGVTNAEGEPMKRYANVSLGKGVEFKRLIVPHEPEPRTSGEGAIHFFPGGRSEHAYIELSDGREGIYTVEVNALTGRVKIYAGPHESLGALDSENEEEESEVKAP
jgi:type II secretory pathway pseudopilin PulG